MKLLKYFQIFFALFLALILQGCKEHRNYNGYLDVDLINLSSDYPGRLTKLNVQRGQIIQKQTEAFVVEQTSENLQTKINNAAIQDLLAQKEQLVAQLKFNEINLQRIAKMRAREASSQTDFDKATEALTISKEQIHAIDANIAKAQSRLELSKWQALRKTNLIENPAIIYDTYALPGEYVNAGSPIAAIIKPDNVKAVFFVPEPQISKIQSAEQIIIKLDGQKNIPAKIRYISPVAEFTSPILYSDTLRQKLVFRVEAQVDWEHAKLSLAALHLGQPITIELTS